MSEELLTVVEAARKLGISPRTIQRYCKQGRLNFKWVNGKRHKELRILSPIPISQLPGGRRRNLAGTFDYITKSDLEEITAELKDNINEKDHRIAMLEEETEKLKSITDKAKNLLNIISSYDSSDTHLRIRIKDFLHEYEKVRPAEKKLILKLAKEVQAHEEYLESIGMKQSEPSDPDME